MAKTLTLQLTEQEALTIHNALRTASTGLTLTEEDDKYYGYSSLKERTYTMWQQLLAESRK
jgi:hypothetical protein